jgi:hypothetical protein
MIAVSENLIKGTVPLSQLDVALFNSLTQDHGRAVLFRSGIGFDDALTRGLASDVATVIAQIVRAGIRGKPSSDLAQSYWFAHVRGAFLQQAHDAASELRNKRIEVTRLTLETALIVGIVSECAHERVPGFSLEQLIELAIDDFFNGGGC